MHTPTVHDIRGTLLEKIEGAMLKLDKPFVKTILPQKHTSNAKA